MVNGKIGGAVIGYGGMGKDTFPQAMKKAVLLNSICF